MSEVVQEEAVSLRKLRPFLYGDMEVSGPTENVDSDSSDSFHDDDESDEDDDTSDYDTSGDDTLFLYKNQEISVRLGVFNILAI